MLNFPQPQDTNQLYWFLFLDIFLVPLPFEFQNPMGFSPSVLPFYFFFPLVRKMYWRKSRLSTPVFLGFPCGWAGKELACNVGDLGSIPGLGRSPWEGKGYPLQYSGLEKFLVDCNLLLLVTIAKDLTSVLHFSIHLIHLYPIFSLSLFFFF